MYAIVETGGKQYTVKPGDTVAVERLAGQPGDTLDLGRVLLVGGNGDDASRVGSPGVDGAIVRAEVVGQIRGEKIIVFRYKSKVRYRRKTGHRQSLTRLRITDIVLDGESSVGRAQNDEPQAALASTRVTAPESPPIAAAPEPTAPAAPESAVPAAATTTTPAAMGSATETDMPASAGEAGPDPEAVQQAPETGAAEAKPSGT